MKKLLRFIIRTALVLFLLLTVITAFHAYKFTHFYDAAEAPVKKEEKKSNWQVTQEILFGAKAYKQKNIMPADSTFEKIDLSTKDHIKLDCWYMKPEGTAKGTVILFHGHGSKKSAVMVESIGFRKMGYNTLLVDFRAHGSSGGNTSTIGWYETEDVKLAYDYIKEKGEKNIILWGISMGAAAVSKAMNDYRLEPSKIILEMPFASVLQAAEGRIKMMGLPGQPLATFVTFWGGAEHGFWAFNMKPSEFVKQIHCPVLLQWGRHDPRVKQEETDLIYANISAPKKLVVYETCGHESLCEKENGRWTATVSEFLSK
jgi:alpha-beta hydrolase superfamily lysophospholipase